MTDISRITTVTVVSPVVNCPIVICPPTELEAAARQALEALEWASDLNQVAAQHKPMHEAIAALRAALKEKA